MTNTCSPAVLFIYRLYYNYSTVCSYNQESYNNDMQQTSDVYILDHACGLICWMCVILDHE